MLNDFWIVEEGPRISLSFIWLRINQQWKLCVVRRSRKDRDEPIYLGWNEFSWLMQLEAVNSVLYRLSQMLAQTVRTRFWVWQNVAYVPLIIFLRFLLIISHLNY